MHPEASHEPIEIKSTQPNSAHPREGGEPGRCATAGATLDPRLRGDERNLQTDFDLFRRARKPPTTFAARLIGREIEPADLWRAAGLAVMTTLMSMVFPAMAAAQQLNINLGAGGGLTDRVIQLAALLTVLSLAPSIVIMTTSFVRMVVVLSLLRTALGLQQSPPNSVLISLAMFLTAIVMAPTFQASYDAGIKPLLDHKMELPQAFNASAAPVKAFMLSQVDREDLGLFVQLARLPKPAHAMDLPIHVVTPAFMISELKRAFEIGFLLFIPFLVIDLVVASVLMSMGMMMLPPVVVSLPFKLIFFVLVDGWRLVAGSLVESFHHGSGLT